MRNATIVIPTLNEEQHIEHCVLGLVAQLPDGATLVVADGGSQDGTRQIVTRLARSDRRISLVNNPGRTQSAAVNLVARAVRGRSDILIRADAHAAYPPTFVADLLSSFERVDAASVVVPMTAVGSSWFQRAVAAAQNSRLGNGGSAHRRGGLDARYVEHGHHALFDLATFDRLGGYDETFRWNEDAEYDVRLRAMGGKVWLCTTAPVIYYPRTAPWPLAVQYFRHGLGRAQTLTKHGLRPKLRQQLPVVAMIANVCTIAASPLVPALLLVPATYATACATWGIKLAVGQRDVAVGASGLAAVIMHMAWASGSLVGRLRSAGGFKPRNRAVASASRA